MSTVAEFHIPPEEFVLAWAIKSVPEVRVEIKRMVAGTTERVMPYFWASCDEIDRFEKALVDDVTIKEVVTLENADTSRFYRATWRPSVRGILYALGDGGATILTAIYDDTTWTLRILFPDHESLSDFHHYSATYDISLELLRLYETPNPETHGKFDVTAEQKEALVVAYEIGYFEVPRQASLCELADRLDISPQAASTRLRRGYVNLIGNTLVRAK